MHLTSEQLTGRVDSHVVVEGVEGSDRALQPECWDAFSRLQRAAAKCGFDMQIVSAFRSFERQLAIWNSKACGQRPVHDDHGVSVEMLQLDALARVHAILRFSALPGASRHHWGTDLDVYDAAAVPASYAVQLTPAEVADDGVFAGLHNWLDQQIGRGEAFGFMRPYEQDRGGVAMERWHLSYTPLAQACARQLTVDVLAQALCDCGLELGDSVMPALADIHQRYVWLPSG